MAGKSDYLEAKLLDHVLGATTYTPPATVYIALFSATPSDSGGGTELSGNNYARAAVTNNTTNWPNATGTNPTSKANGVPFNFPAASADWVAAVAFGIFDASTGGNLLYWAPLTASVTVLSGKTAQFNAGNLTVTDD